MIIAIDPGPEQSAMVIYGSAKIFHGIYPNKEVLERLSYGNSDITHLAIEMVACYGMAVGAEVFETCVWIGRFIQQWNKPYTLVYRRDVKLHLCQSARAKDANIRQALLDRFGGSRDKAIGNKSNPGPLYGISSHLWSALAVAVTYEDTNRAPRSGRVE